MALVRPFSIVSMIAACELPWSQTSSVRFGAPTCGLPLPSAPWHAAQIVSNFCFPRYARRLSAVRPESVVTLSLPPHLADLDAFPVAAG